MPMTPREYPSPRASDLRELADREGPVLSLFVPVTAAIPDAAQNPVRHERVVAQAIERWASLGADASALEEAERALSGFAGESRAPAASVAARAAFWSADRGVRSFGLPFSTDESVRVAGCAALRPIAGAVQRASRYRVLALSPKRVALFEGDEDGLERASSAELPESLEDALGHEVTEPALQFHSGSSGGEHPVYHGQGGASRGRDVDQRRFHQRVARALEAEIGDDVVPLVLAADARHRPGLEAELARDVGLLPGALEGNADHLSAAALHAAAWPRVAGARPDAHEALKRARDGKEPVVTQISELVSCAVMGRVRRLWVPERGAIPGRIDRMRGRAAEAWGDDDLIESLAAEVVRRAGEVLVLAGVEFSAESESLAAQLR